jgi:hypothetical protein
LTIGYGHADPAQGILKLYQVAESLTRHSGARRKARTRNPHFYGSAVWIPGSRAAHAPRNDGSGSTQLGIIRHKDFRMKDESPPPSRGPHDRGDDDDQAPSPLVILIVMTVIALACVGGYFFVMKLIDISRQEDCLIAGRRNCAPIEAPSNR